MRDVAGIHGVVLSSLPNFSSFPNSVWERKHRKFRFGDARETEFRALTFPNGVWEREWERECERDCEEAALLCGDRFLRQSVRRPEALDYLPRGDAIDDL